MIHLFHCSDPATHARGQFHRWSWVYLHGAAECHNAHVQEASDWDWAAPDLFMADTPMPEEPGDYICSLYGMEVVAVIRPRHSGSLEGRAACNVETLPCYQHAHAVDDWM